MAATIIVMTQKRKSPLTKLRNIYHKLRTHPNLLKKNAYISPNALEIEFPCM